MDLGFVRCGERCVVLNNLCVGDIIIDRCDAIDYGVFYAFVGRVWMNCLFRPRNDRFRSGLCFGLICGIILMMDLSVFCDLI